MFHLLCDNPYGLHTKELMDRLYADDPDGGPENNSVVGVMVWRFNKMARQNRLGLEIHTRAGYKRALNGGRYCIWVVRH
jgi:hypothetical protein